MEKEESKGSFVILIGEKKLMASHLITVEGVLEDKWNKPFLTDFIKKKVETEINDSWQAEIELLRIEVKEKTEIKIGVFIAGIGSLEMVKQWSREWLEKHIGNFAIITKLEVRPMSPLARSCVYE